MDDYQEWMGGNLRSSVHRVFVRWYVVFDVNDTLDTLRVRVTGISAETWDWVGYVEYFMVNSSS